MKKLLFLCALFVALSSCSKTERKPINQSDDSIVSNNVPDSIDFDNLDLNPRTTNTFELTVSRLKGASFIQKKTLKDGHVSLVFYNNFDSYKVDHPTSNLENSNFTSYFDSEKSVLKTIISAAGKILEKEPSVNSVEIQKIFNGKNYHILVTRKSLLKNNITLDNFSDKYVYNNAGREMFYNTFKK